MEPPFERSTNHARPKSARARFSNLPVRKRRRVEQVTTSAKFVCSDEDDEVENLRIRNAELSNPLSLPPGLKEQYKLAGLRMDQELPSTRIKSFPHRALPNGYRTDLDVGEDIEDRDEGKMPETRAGIGEQLGSQHRENLTMELHRMLGSGKIKQATRCFAILMRGQVDGKPFNIMESGYWGIGAELCVRAFDPEPNDDDSDQGIEDEDRWDLSEDGKAGEKRWGTAEGLAKAKEYYETLILQYPYQRAHPHRTCALDLWPAMIECEIYGIQYEQQDRLRKIAMEAEKDEEDEARSDSESQMSDAEEEDNDDSQEAEFHQSQRRQDRRAGRREERRYLERDQVRRDALLAAGGIAVRLDELMTTPPYSESHDLLRLRGMIALYIGDLGVPESPSHGDLEGGVRLIYRERLANHLGGLEIRTEQHQLARKLFDKIEREGGDAEDLRDLAVPESDDDEEQYE